MNRTILFSALAAALLPGTLHADPRFYGRANISFELVDEQGHSGTALESNNSRLGVRGSETLSDGLEAVYQFEYKIDIDGDDDSTFSRRNNFLALQGDWGRVVGGYFDTPLKVTEGRVDQFNDVHGDLGKVITAHNDRKSNMVMYSTPQREEMPVRGSIAWISSEGDGRSDGVSASVAWEREGIYLALGADQDVEAEGTDVARLVSVFTTGSWQVGGLVETADRALLGSADGWVLSTRYQMDDRWSLKGQLGASDIVTEGGETISLGVDYTASESTTAYGFITGTDNDAGQDAGYVGVGVMVNF